MEKNAGCSSEHMQDPDVENYICDHCGKGFEEKSKLVAHIKACNVTKGTLNINLDINRSFPSSARNSKSKTNKKGISKLHKRNRKLYRCHACDAEYETLRSEVHIEIEIELRL